MVAGQPGVLDRAEGLSDYQGPSILTVLVEMEADKLVEDLGAVNRWPAQSGVSLEEYLQMWRASCAQIDAPGRLPARLQAMFGLHRAGEP